MPIPFKNPEKGLSSLFGVLRASKTQAGPAQAAENKPVPSPSSAASGAEDALEKRMGALERDLRIAHERAIAAEIRLREREDARAFAQRETEAILQASASQRRSEEAFQRLSDQLSAGSKRIEELESRIIEADRVKDQIAKSEELLRRLSSDAAVKLESQASRSEALLKHLAAAVEAKLGESALGVLAERVSEALKSIEGKFVMNEGELSIARTQAALRESEVKELRGEIESLRARVDEMTRRME